MADEELQLTPARGGDGITDQHFPVVKAHFIGRDGTELSNVHPAPQPNQDLFKGTGAIEPPIDPNELAALFEMSGALRTNVDTYATNIDGFGHDFQPIVDLDDEDTFEVVRQALLEEKIRDALAEDGDPEQTAKRLMRKIMQVQKVVSHMALAENESEGETPEDEADLAGLDIEVTDAEVEEKLEELRRTMVWEEQLLKTFFDYCCIDMSFVKLRTITRQDEETLGNGYWEVLRNETGEPVQFSYIPGFTVRLMPADKEPQTVPMLIPRTLLRVDEEPVRRRFRRYVQVLENEGVKVWFKQFGDPRIYSSKTGKPYETRDQLEAKEPGCPPATELLHFKVHSARTPYGIPRWISELLAVLGNRHAEEINLAYFENKSIPPMAILVSGGRLAKNETERLRDFIKNEIRGKRNFHKILVLQAEPFQGNLTGTNSGSVKIEIKPLTQTQNDDGLFMNYQEANADRIGGVFRTPRLLRGDVRDFNRATADASLAFAERQVFAPLRKDFDWVMNRQIMPALGVRFWSFVSKGPETTDLGELGKLLNEAARSGYLSLKELREIASRVFGKKFAQHGEEVEEMLVPLEMLRLGLAGTDEDDLDDGEDLPEDPEEDTPEQAAKRAIRRRKARAALKLMALESHFQDQARKDAALDFEKTHALVNGFE